MTKKEKLFIVIFVAILLGVVYLDAFVLKVNLNPWNGVDFTHLFKK